MKMGLTIIFALALVPVLACGDDASLEKDAQDEYQRLLQPARMLSLEDLTAAGLKASKEYDVSELPGATDSWLMFWKVKGVSVQYEVRFYPSHTAAVDEGMSYAEEGAGAKAIIDPDFARYTEGMRDRRTIVHTRSSPTPRYGDYMIIGNLIALCEGRDGEQGRLRCMALADALDES